MSSFTRQTHPTSWIGYPAAATKKPVAIKLTPDGDVVNKPLRPEVYVREFPSVLVKEVSVSDREGRGGTRSVSIKFDAASCETGSDKKLKHDFAASTIEGSDVHKAAVWCHERGLPVYVAIETRRRYRSKGGDIVPYTTPMYVLRGSQPDGSGANSNTTGENCGNAIAVIGPAADQSKNIISAEAQTNPEEWDLFRHNRDGSTPPEGWQRIYTVDGEVGGAIVVSKNTASGDAGATVDAQAVADLVLAAMRGDDHADRPVQRLRSVEGKPWEMVNLDGRLNPSSYAVQAIRWTRKDAVDLVQSAAYASPKEADELGNENLGQAASDLVKPLMWAASRVQQTALGYERQTEPSWRESAKWVMQVAMAEQPYELEYISDREAGSDWIKRVAAAAGDLYSSALQLAATIVGAPTGADAQPEGRPDSDTAPQPEASAPSEDPAQAANVDPCPTLADSADLVARWDALIETVNMAKFVDRLNPILEQTFGTHLSTEIPADRFEPILQAWEKDPQRFLESAKSAASTAA